MNTEQILSALAYVIFAPILGGLVAGIDRKITAKMQGRVGPPLLQPFYDVLKLFEKEKVVVSRSQNFYVLTYLVFMAFTGALSYSGGDILLVIFALTLAHVFLVLGAYSVNSPYSYLGAERELIQIMLFEPIIILTAAGMYMVSKLTIEGGSFRVWDIATLTTPVILYLPGLFLAFIYVLNVKLRKSPFDLSTSHHAHQELVKGVTTEFSGSTLGRIEIAHWYETVLLMGFIYLFFGYNPLIAVAAIIIIYLFEILVDNTFSRFKWPLAMKSAWMIALILGLVNLCALYYVKGGSL